MSPRTMNCAAAADVVALVAAIHHEHDELAAEMLARMDSVELAVTLINAVHALTDCYEADARRAGVDFDEFLHLMSVELTARTA